MTRIILNRLAVLLPTILFGSILIFGLVHIIPGGAALAILGPEASPEDVVKLNHELGLDRPIATQYGDWLWTILHGDFGRSLIDQRDIGQDIIDRLPLTFELAAVALLLALMIGVPLGIFSAARQHSRIDAAVTGLSGLGLALPEFWLAMLAVNFFALKLGWVPAIGINPLSDGIADHLNSLILPSLTLASGAAAVITRFTRSSMIDVLSAPYIRTARALGLPPSQIYLRFALKNALPPVVTIVGILGGGLLGGAVLVEQVFVIPGLGAMLVQSTLQKDYPTVQGVALALTIPVILINLGVDIACALLDPRSRR